MIADHSNPSHQPVFSVSSHEIAAPNHALCEVRRYDFALRARKRKAHGPSPTVFSRAASHADEFKGLASTTGVPGNDASRAPNFVSSCSAGAGSP
jgi:hypothetical protein